MLITTLGIPSHILVSALYWYPVLQVLHWYPPTVFSHVSPVWHSWVPVTHSSMSIDRNGNKDVTNSHTALSDLVRYRGVEASKCTKAKG